MYSMNSTWCHCAAARHAFLWALVLLFANASGVPGVLAADVAFGSAAQAASLEALPRYQLAAELMPETHQLTVDATVDLPVSLAGKKLEFLLAAPLKIDHSEPAVTPLPGDPKKGFAGINGSSAALGDTGRAARYSLQLAPGQHQIKLHYAGPVDFGFETPAQEYARGFNETMGTLGKDGVYLAGSTLWIPYFGDGLFTFDLTAKGPEGWQLISPGNGTARDANGVAHWSSNVPVDELHIVGGPLISYRRAAGAVQAQVFLRTKDDALAAKYLEATARYIEMYRALIGPYPYEKFALVENFWETGYGMPSFTLLGSQIIRFPFIITSSYPHEILHNWWGNSVFVDYNSGNWCEGLTAYLADHMLKEQAGQGAEYRRDTLKKYRDFVGEAHDFPLSKFLSRHSPATEAVGYGKALMTFHMVRQIVGDEAYRRGLQRFYREQRGKRASFDDLRRAHENTSQAKLEAFFRQWVTRTGAPDLRVVGAAVKPDNGGYLVTGRLHQQQKEAPFAIEVPLRVQTETGLVEQRVRMTGRDAVFTVTSRAKPLGLAVDPEFDLFRLLDSRETAPSLGQVFGDAAVVAVLPASADEAHLAAYRAMLKAWESPVTKVTVTTDATLKELPAGAAAWVFGRDNKFAAKLFASEASIGYAVDSDGINANGERVDFAGHSIVVVRRHPANPAKAIAWIAVDPLSAAPGLARKLPHYGKYSYLGFEGEEPANKARGEWSASDSPLRVDLRPIAGRSAALPAVKSPPRAALAELPALFNEQAMLQSVQWLAAPEREGRGLGSPGLLAASDYVAEQMRAAGLAPGGDNGSFFQDFPVESTPAANGSVASAPVKPGTSARNVIGVLKGSNPAFEGQWVVLSAHYDHLGRNGVGVRVSELGQIHPGADDNASGTAVMLELARALAAAGAPQRTIVFIGFSAEEAKLQGSRYFAQHPTPLPLTGLRAVVNLDTVGHLHSNPLSVLATGTANEWAPIIQGVGFETGVAIRSIAGAGESSDQQSFIAKGIPGVQLFSGANLDYHRPTDTADKVDSAGLGKVAMVAREIVSYLAERPAPLSVTIANANSASGAGVLPGAGGTRRVAFGLVPDYAYAGTGVRADSVAPGSPAALAGFQAGDVLVELAGAPIANLSSFSEKLKTLAPGDAVKAVVLRGDARDGQRIERLVKLVER